MFQSEKVVEKEWTNKDNQNGNLSKDLSLYFGYILEISLHGKLKLKICHVTEALSCSMIWENTLPENNSLLLFMWSGSDKFKIIIERSENASHRQILKTQNIELLDQRSGKFHSVDTHFTARPHLGGTLVDLCSLECTSLIFMYSCEHRPAVKIFVLGWKYYIHRFLHAGMVFSVFCKS